MDLDRSTVGRDDLARDVEAQAKAAPLDPSAPLEAAEQSRLDVGRDARAMVLDLDLGPAAESAKPDDDVGRVGGVNERVRQQVEEDLLQAGAIGQDEQIPLGFLDPQLPAAAQASRDLDSFADERPERDQRRLDGKRAAAGEGDVKELVDEPVEAICLVDGES
jgi:hypothetical protein